MKNKRSIQSLVLGLGLGLIFGAQTASAAIVNYSPCKDKQNMGWGGLACTVAPGDFTLAPPAKNDSEANVETVLAYIFGAFVNVTPGATGVSGDQTGFDFSVNNFGGTATSLGVLLTDTYEFMTFKAGDVWGIADIRGLTNFNFTTDNLIENHKGSPLAFSHLSFWNPYIVTKTPSGDTPRPVPAPLGMGLVGLGLLALAGGKFRKKITNLI